MLSPGSTSQPSAKTHGLHFFIALVWASSLFIGCRPPAPTIHSTRLVDVFDASMVSGSPAAIDSRPGLEWSFDAQPPLTNEPTATHGWRSAVGMADLRIEDGALRGLSLDENSLIQVTGLVLPEHDLVHAIEIRMQATSGDQLGIWTSADETLHLKTQELLSDEAWHFSSPLIAGDSAQTYVLKPRRPRLMSELRNLVIRPSNAAQSRISIDSIRIISRREHLASIQPGVGFHGLGGIFRESLSARAPESIAWTIEPGKGAWLDISLGTLEAAPLQFEIKAHSASEVHSLARRTLSTANRWESLRVDLQRFAGARITLSLELSSSQPGDIGLWGSPVLRHPLPEGRQNEAPQGVIVLWVDTLRQDHLQANGYERETSPRLEELAAQGIRFDHSISQATWTKVSTPALLTSMVPLSNGVREFSDRLPSAAETLAEIYRREGYATVSYSSNLFTGQFTNLHQGFEELHEESSLPEDDNKKTARPYISRAIDFIEGHQDLPFLIFLHLLDPHDPFEPRAPYDRMWADAGLKTRHLEAQSKLVAHIENPMARSLGFPNLEELEAAGIDPDQFIADTIDWYDGSIRGMDAEIGRLLERLAQLGLDQSTLIVFAADHGEEFLDHGATFHGHSVYQELAQTPLAFRWPGRIDAGGVVDQLVSTIDVMPTLLDLSGLQCPEGCQGQSLVPLIDNQPADWVARPAFVEKAKTESGSNPWPVHTEIYAVLDGSLKLIHNSERDAGTPQFELYDLAVDPAETSDIAASMQGEVGRLSRTLARWRREAAAQALPLDDELAAGLSDEQLERLRSLGYLR